MILKFGGILIKIETFDEIVMLYFLLYRVFLKINPMSGTKDQKQRGKGTVGRARKSLVSGWRHVCEWRTVCVNLGTKFISTPQRLMTISWTVLFKLQQLTSPLLTIFFVLNYNVWLMLAMLSYIYFFSRWTVDWIAMFPLISIYMILFSAVQYFCKVGKYDTLVMFRIAFYP